MSIAGKDFVLKISTSTGSFTAVDELNSATLSIVGTNIDISEFTNEFVQRIQGLKDVTYSLGGFYDPADTNGQVKIRSALVNDTVLYVQILPDGTTTYGFDQEVKVASFDIDASVDGAVELSIELEGTGTLTIV